MIVIAVVAIAIVIAIAINDIDGRRSSSKQ
ncbi:hypothetical protein HRbin04_01309 [archaeon HR04]|nr:hypothetical protein HRbin04_01309 [archaeon HR04]